MASEAQQSQLERFDLERRPQCSIDLKQNVETLPLHTQKNKLSQHKACMLYTIAAMGFDVLDRMPS